MRDPAFWWQPPGLAARLLWPAAAVYGAITARRMSRGGRRAGIPVVCVGNFTLGGTGKTPATVAIVDHLARLGETPFVLTRGYGGREPGPLRVLPSHKAADVGDEPLLLARAAPVIVARDRAAGAALAEAEGASVIVMDDGLQNPTLRKDLSFAVIDARRGSGNGCVFPAGPLRASLVRQVPHVHALIAIGTGPGTAQAETLAQEHRMPLLRASLTPYPDAIAAFRGHPLLAFAGIGDPLKFFATLTEAGLDVQARVSFPDHHPFTEGDARGLLAQCREKRLRPVTTEKDLVRLAAQDGALQELAVAARALPVSLIFEEPERLRDILRNALRQRRDSEAGSALDHR
jgi:tetraacyldisaccharide 4'-kinase